LFAKSLFEHGHRAFEIEQRKNFRASEQERQSKTPFGRSDATEGNLLTKGERGQGALGNPARLETVSQSALAVILSGSEGSAFLSYSRRIGVVFRNQKAKSRFFVAPLLRMTLRHSLLPRSGS
jgi:hypothetical protein